MATEGMELIHIHGKKGISDMNIWEAWQGASREIVLKAIHEGQAIECWISTDPASGVFVCTILEDNILNLPQPSATKTLEETIEALRQNPYYYWVVESQDWTPIFDG